MLKDLTSCGLGGAERPYKLWTGTEVLKDLTSCGLGGAERPYKLWTGSEVLKDLTSCGQRQTTTISTDRLKEMEVKRGCIPQRSGRICGQPD